MTNLLPIGAMPQVLSNFNLFFDDKGYAGVCSEIKLPTLKIKKESIRVGGLDGPVSLDMGMEEMECEITLLEYSMDVLSAFGFKLGGAIKMTAKGAMKGAPLAMSPSVICPVTAMMTGRILEIDMGTWKSGEKAEMKFKVDVIAYSLSIMGKELINIDHLNMIRIIDGVDQLADIKIAIGRM